MLQAAAYVDFRTKWVVKAAIDSITRSLNFVENIVIIPSIFGILSTPSMEYPNNLYVCMNTFATYRLCWRCQTFVCILNSESLEDYFFKIISSRSLGRLVVIVTQCVMPSSEKWQTVHGILSQQAKWCLAYLGSLFHQSTSRVVYGSCRNCCNPLQNTAL